MTRDCSTVRIFTDIPVPKLRRKTDFPWHKLGVGHSFFASDLSEAKTRQSTAKHKGMKLTYRRLDDGRVMLWRVK